MEHGLSSARVDLFSQAQKTWCGIFLTQDGSILFEIVVKFKTWSKRKRKKVCHPPKMKCFVLTTALP